MYTASSKYDNSILRIRIDITKSGSNEFNHLNALLGRAYIRLFQLKRDLAEYIEHHIESGNPLTAEFDVLYEDNICLTIFCSDGTYYIKGVSLLGKIVAIKAVLLWARVKHGCDYLLRQVLAGWRWVRAKAEPTACCI